MQIKSKDLEWREVFLFIQGLFLYQRFLPGCGNKTGLLPVVVSSSFLAVFFSLFFFHPFISWKYGAWHYLEKEMHQNIWRKGGWEADLLAWDFCGYFLLFYELFLVPESAGCLALFRKREENGEFFVGGWNMDEEGKERGKREKMGRFWVGFWLDLQRAEQKLLFVNQQKWNLQEQFTPQNHFLFQTTVFLLRLFYLLAELEQFFIKRYGAKKFLQQEGETGKQNWSWSSLEVFWNLTRKHMQIIIKKIHVIEKRHSMLTFQEQIVQKVNGLPEDNFRCL